MRTSWSENFIAKNTQNAMKGKNHQTLHRITRLPKILYSRKDRKQREEHRSPKLEQLCTHSGTVDETINS